LDTNIFLSISVLDAKVCNIPVLDAYIADNPVLVVNGFKGTATLEVMDPANVLWQSTTYSNALVQNARDRARMLYSNKKMKLYQI
jgi:hypothetical protein